MLKVNIEDCLCTRRLNANSSGKESTVKHNNNDVIENGGEVTTYQEYFDSLRVVDIRVVPVNSIDETRDGAIFDNIYNYIL